MTTRDSSNIHKLPKITFDGDDIPRQLSDDDTSTIVSESHSTYTSRIHTQRPTRCNKYKAL